MEPFTWNGSGLRTPPGFGFDFVPIDGHTGLLASRESWSCEGRHSSSGSGDRSGGVGWRKVRPSFSPHASRGAACNDQSALARARAFSPLADQRWVTVALAFLKELDVITSKRLELTTAGAPQRNATGGGDPNPKAKASAKKKGKGGGKQGGHQQGAQQEGEDE